MMMKKKNLEAKHIPTHASSSSSSSSPQEIQVGSLYEVDHTKLPLTTREHLKSIRVVMVNNKSLHQISVSFPSFDSLKTHMMNPDGLLKKLPELDEKHFLTTEMASDVLYRSIPTEEVQEQSKTWRFWMVRRCSESCLLSETMNNSGMVQWGMWGKRKNDKNEENPKRERQVTKRLKQSNTHNKMVTARWTENRYKSAEENILKVMKATCAYADNPILRAPLRSEARKLIGDTGLIDHLLKNMVGKVFPGGAERFQRRCNDKGVLEFWLESVEIREDDAGVEDQNLTPTAGVDPNCVRMFDDLWQFINQNMKRVELDLVTTSNCFPTNVHHGQALQDKYTELLAKKSKFEEHVVKLYESLSTIGEELRSVLEQMGELKPTTEEKAPVDTEFVELPVIVSEDIQGEASNTVTPLPPRIDFDLNKLPADCNIVTHLPRSEIDLNELPADYNDQSSAVISGSLNMEV